MQNSILCIILFFYIYNKIIIYISIKLVIAIIAKIIFFKILQIFSESITTNQYKKLFNQGLQGSKMYYLLPNLINKITTNECVITEKK